MSFRFIHTADWQIGKPFGNVPGDAGAALRRQRIDTVAALARLASERQVDAVLVAGDAFDSNEVEDRTIYHLLSALAPFGGKWIFLPGNHDAALPHSVWTRLRRLSSGENIAIAEEPSPIVLHDAAAVILPAPLKRRRESSDLTGWFDHAETPPGAVRIGLAHGSVANRLPAASEATNAIADTRAETARLDYLALGDWHGTVEIAPRTWYPGTPETDRHRNNASGNVLLVEVDHAGAAPRVEVISVGAFAWRRLEVAILDGDSTVVDNALQSLDAEPGRAVVELVLSGFVSLAERYRLEAELTQWRARLHHLTVDDEALREEPTADDLDALGGGFVRLAVERLGATAEDAASADQAAARMALRLLYLDHMRAGARE